MKLLKSRTSSAATNGGDAGEGRKTRKQKKKGMFGDAGLKGFLASHLEKMLLGLALLIAAFMVFSGFRSRAGIDGDKSPAHLNQQSDAATSHINRFTWEDNYRPDRDLDKNFKERADQTLELVEVAAYITGKNEQPLQLFKPPYMPAQTLRTDPDLLPPQELIVRAGVAPLAAVEGGDVTGRFSSRALGEGEGVRPAEQRKNQGWRKYFQASGSTKGKYFTSILALVPYKQQLEEYNNRLKNTLGYEPSRDQPKYVDWWLQRAESKDDGTEPNWKNLARDSVALNAEKEWAVPAVAPELNPDGKFVNKILTKSVPPLLIDDLPKYAVHELLPREVPPADTESDGPTEPTDEWGPFARSPERGGTARQDGGRHNVGGLQRAQSSESTAERSGGGDRGMETGEFLMFRYFDLTAEPGKTYVYRLALLLDDPNNPSATGEGGEAPDDVYLDQEVSERLLKERTEEKKPWWYPYRRTMWSDPSSPVHIPEGNRMLAGVVTPAEPTTVPGKPGGFLRLGEEPRATVLALTFEPSTGANIPGEREVSRGTYGNFAQPAEVQIPLSNEIRAVGDHVFRTDTLVVDIRGGGPLGTSRLRAPGEVLILDRQGRLQVLNELDDADAYRQNYIEPAPVAVVTSDRDEEREGRGRREDNEDPIDRAMRNTRRGRGEGRRTEGGR
jgi:hypothetical protein